MPKSVVSFLNAVANQAGYEVFDSLYGSINLGEAFPITQSSGAVYGIWVQADQPPRNDLSCIPGYQSWYPVYWGKDISPMSRMKAHVQGHQNGNINLPNVVEVRGKALIYGAILVSRYWEFEQLLYRDYRPMLGSPAEGRRSTIVQVKNGA